MSQNVTVTVRQAAVSIAIDPRTATLMAIDETVQLTAAVRDGNGHPVSGAEVAWSSSDETVATVSVGGLVTAVMNGTATITARTGSLSDTVMVTVLVPRSDRNVLIAFYESTGGEQWSVKSNWLSVHALESWYGVTVNADGRVTGNRLAEQQPAWRTHPRTGFPRRTHNASHQSESVEGAYPDGTRHADQTATSGVVKKPVDRGDSLGTRSTDRVGRTAAVLQPAGGFHTGGTG